MTKLPFDEITDLARERITADVLDQLSDDEIEEELEDEIEDLIIMAYALGWGLFLDEYDEQLALNQKSLTEALQTKIEGKTYQEYLEPHIAEKDIEGIYRVVDTTVHQMFEQAQLDCAKQVGKETKTWLTMEDDEVRQTHRYLEGVSVPIDERFYTIDGDSAPCPGLFASAQNNVNCRCILHYD